MVKYVWRKFLLRGTTDNSCCVTTDGKKCVGLAYWTYESGCAGPSWGTLSWTICTVLKISKLLSPRIHPRHYLTIIQIPASKSTISCARGITCRIKVTRRAMADIHVTLWCQGSETWYRRSEDSCCWTAIVFSDWCRIRDGSGENRRGCFCCLDCVCHFWDIEWLREHAVLRNLQFWTKKKVRSW